MNEIGKIVAFSLAVVVLGALLAPPMYWAGMWLAEIDLIPFLGRVPFARYFNRAVLIAAIALIWPFLRWLGLGSWRELGLQPNSRRWRDLGVGIAISVTGLWLVAAGVVLVGAAELKTIRAEKVLGALATGAAVALIEELFFRGALFGVLRRSLSWPRALAFLSVLFAVVHFIKPHPAARKVVDVGWLTGFEMLPYAFHRFTDPKLVLVGWLTLVIFGWILGYVVVRTRSLYMAIGLHGGWVFALRAFMLNSRRAGNSSVWIGHDLTVGIVPVALLLCSLGLLWWILRGCSGAARGGTDVG